MVMIMTLDLRIITVIQDLTVMALYHPLAVIVVIIAMILDLHPIVVQGLQTMIALDLQLVVTIVADPVLRPNVIQGLCTVIFLDLQLAIIIVMNPLLRLIVVNQDLHRWVLSPYYRCWSIWSCPNSSNTIPNTISKSLSKLAVEFSLVDTHLKLKSLVDGPLVHPIILMIELLCAIPS